MYLSIIAQPGPVTSKTLEVNAEQLLADWQLGMRLIGFRRNQDKYIMERVSIPTKSGQGVIPQVESTARRIVGKQVWSTLRDAYQQVKERL